MCLQKKLKKGSPNVALKGVYWNLLRKFLKLEYVYSGECGWANGKHKYAV